MAFDEQGQADTVERKRWRSVRAHINPRNEVGFPPEESSSILISLSGTGIEEHNNYAVTSLKPRRS